MEVKAELLTRRLTTEKSPDGMKEQTHLVPGTTNDRREHGPRSVVASEAGFAHAGAIVDHKSGNIVVTHLVWKGCAADRSRRKPRIETNKYLNNAAPTRQHTLTTPPSPNLLQANY